MGQRLAAVGNEVKAHPAGAPAGCLAWIIHEDAPFCNQPLERGVYLPMFTRTACDVGLLGRWRPISGHLAASSKLGAKEIFSRHRFRHARLANSPGYWQRRSSRKWLGNRLAIIPSPS